MVKAQRKMQFWFFCGRLGGRVGLCDPSLFNVWKGGEGQLSFYSSAPGRKMFRVAKLERQMRRNALSCSSTQILASFIGQTKTWYKHRSKKD